MTSRMYAPTHTGLKVKPEMVATDNASYSNSTGVSRHGMKRCLPGLF
ncbi:hypothetical protein [Streptomyces montanus]|nr:hypothetical protein [Streptomyces montanus]